jgi:hypothetical protein
LELAIIMLVPVVAQLQSAQYEAVAAMKRDRAVKTGQFLDATLALLDQLIEVNNE